MQLQFTTAAPFRRPNGDYQVNFTVLNNSKMEAVELRAHARLTNDTTRTEITRDTVRGSAVGAGSEWRTGVFILIAGWYLWPRWVEWRWRDPKTGRVSDGMTRSGLP